MVELPLLKKKVQRWTVTSGTPGLRGSKDIIRTRFLSAAQLSYSLCVVASFPGSTWAQNNYSGPSRPAQQVKKEELMIAYWSPEAQLELVLRSSAGWKAEPHRGLRTGTE